MSARKRIRQGFTLVEILIVVVILGILAAIVIPQFSSASDAAQASSVVSQLQTIRSQLELSRIQHAGTYPTLSTNWNHLTTSTEAVAAYTAGNASGNEVGPYLQKSPVNPFSNSSTVGTCATGVGWAYSTTTGVITACVPTAKAGTMDTTNDITLY